MVISALENVINGGNLMSCFFSASYTKLFILLVLSIFVTGFISRIVVAECPSTSISLTYKNSSCSSKEEESKLATIHSWENKIENLYGSECSDWDHALSKSLGCVFSSNTVMGVTWCKTTCTIKGTPSELLCSPPSSNDNWIITTNCKLMGSKVAHKNVLVRNGAVLTIANSAALDIDFVNYHLKVEKGSGVLIKKGGKIH